MTLLSTSVSLTSAPRQFHDFLGRDSASATPAHVLDQGATAIVLARGGGPFDAHGVSIQLEFDLGIWQEAKLPPQGQWNRDLAFARYPQVLLLPVRVLPLQGSRQPLASIAAARPGEARIDPCPTARLTARSSAPDLVER